MLPGDDPTFGRRGTRGQAPFEPVLIASHRKPRWPCTRCEILVTHGIMTRVASPVSVRRQRFTKRSTGRIRRSAILIPWSRILRPLRGGTGRGNGNSGAPFPIQLVQSARSLPLSPIAHEFRPAPDVLEKPTSSRSHLDAGAAASTDVRRLSREGW